MCRLMAYMGPPVLVADVVLWPDRSILKQSYDARERKMDASLPQHLVSRTSDKEQSRDEAKGMLICQHSHGCAGIWQPEW